ncbi:MAG: hypothetical protein RI100_07975 [Nitrosarchaeum sp.]|jgi:hypothetical protein|uniref:hypothetical protein n=1 Tax=Nitrosarchaeum sp. TaxID=2026886 RepID=UPI002DE8C212|nr:hypothetical protein [Nitrosarchaeum sp.]
MKEMKLGVIFPHNFKGKFLIAIEEGWKNFFTTDPTFEVVIDKDRRYTLRGPIVQNSQHDPTVAQEDTDE